MHQHSSLLINGNWTDGEGPVFESLNPADHSRIWQGQAASHQQIAETVHSARQALQHWRQHTPEQRGFQLQQFLRQIQAHRLLLSDTLAQESGQTAADARQELTSLEQLIEQHLVPAAENGEIPQPRGVIVLISSFSQPLISPLRAMIPILLAGNTLIFKPSEHCPRCAELMLHLWLKADLPDGVINLLQGGPEVALGLAQQEQIDGIHFSGQRCHALQLHQLLAGRPGVALQLHTSGNNCLFIDSRMPDEHWPEAIISSAFRSAGQRCCAARRLLIDRSEAADKLLQQLLQRIETLQQEQALGFMGTIIDARAAQQLLQRQTQLQQRGGNLLLPMQPAPDNECLLSAGIIDISHLNQLPETEVFGPLLQVVRVADAEQAIELVNQDRELLVAGLFSHDSTLCQRMMQQLQSPLISCNLPLDQILLQPDTRLWRSAGYSNSDFTRPHIRFTGAGGE
ncbi:aldehyde dehydrogenase family protein [Marinobacterium jannaschii]|uniref:aldehyde dehydrogenase family protein n=1 Tax=Marinobacterium jannaschii TaxID=64970 RepID=UPI000684FC96|nr:aldehyde dehydrogenase family protein [Marinobacterium jannaschii]